MKIHQSFKKVSVMLLAVTLAACTHPMYKSAERGIDDTRTKIATAKDEYAMLKRDKDSKFTAYRLAKFRNKHTPAWLKKHISFRVNEASFAFIAQKILTGTPAITAFEPDVDQAKKLSFNFRGTIGGALKALQAKSGYGYRIDTNLVTWSVLVSKTFDISFMPGASTYLLGQSGNGSPKDMPQDLHTRADDQYSNLKGRLSVWDDLYQTLNQMKSKNGEVYVSQATTSVTIRDTPARLNAIEAFLDTLNLNLSREVALQVQVLEVDMKNGFNYGIDWQLVRHFMNLAIGAQGALARPVNLMPLGANANDGAAGFIIRGNEGSRWDGTSILINAISQQGNVSTVTRPRVVTLNNQVAEIDINTQTGYLREVNTTTVGAASATTTALTPGTVKTGFTLYLLPKIQKKNVYLQISSTISNLLNIVNIKGNPNASAENNSQIQLPTVTEKHFNQRSLVPSGATLILAGFKQVHNEANKSDVFRASPLGSRGAKQGNTETIVLITPTVLDRS